MSSDMERAKKTGKVIISITDGTRKAFVEVKLDDIKYVAETPEASQCIVKELVFKILK